jgi:hypothetical protein
MQFEPIFCLSEPFFSHPEVSAEGSHLSTFSGERELLTLLKIKSYLKNLKKLKNVVSPMMKENPIVINHC